MKLGTLMLVDVSRSVLLFRTLHPTNIVIIPLAAVRAGKTGLLDLLLLIENISFVHYFYSTPKAVCPA